ncbi:sensor histidine kinase [Shewanella sp. 10N.7]|uniref:sensor histidine kinase n=1 Tax=Shewanella sp. 10N.7 TaxID=2885093 RepID=UPI001E50DB51|nr:HAMP domain-containing sensor histidine kinase [Shewanella sp. 10N.7]MCC4833713.1 sensor histidine kinase [Shewanella sp. 10N.7]
MLSKTGHIVGSLNSNKEQLAFLRLLNLLLKLGLILFGIELFDLTRPPNELSYVLFLEAVYVAFCYRYRFQCINTPSILLITLIVDILFWSTWLFYTGGATNAFVSLLLLPVAIGAVTLPRWAPWILTFLSTSLYTLMMLTMPENRIRHHGMDMSSHYLGMWFNFVISALVLTITVGYIAKRVRQKNAQLSYLREAQLRQEKLLALGTVSAQMAHQMATPLSTLRLLVDELVEDGTAKDIEPEMQQALTRCETTLADLRLATESIRQQKAYPQKVDKLVSNLHEQVQLLMPETELTIEIDTLAAYPAVNADTSLLPALLALIENGARASLENIQKAQVTLSVTSGDSGQLCFNIRDFGKGMNAKELSELGNNVVTNPKGMGIGVLLSHASFERLGGQLSLSRHNQGGTIASVMLPANYDE